MLSSIARMHRFATPLLLLVALTAAQNITYDYVIAGAGTAGLLLAVVLSENPNITVAVLEGGGDGRQDPNVTIPELRGVSIQNNLFFRSGKAYSPEVLMERFRRDNWHTI